MNYVEFSEFLVKIYENTASLCLVIVGPIFLLRIVQNSLMGSSQDFIEIFKGLVACFILLFGFRYILEGITLFLDDLYPKNVSLDAESFLKEGHFDGPWALMKILQSLTIILFWVGSFIQLFVLSILSALAPVVFVLGTLLGIGLGVKIFLGMLIMSSTWPIVWEAIDQVSTWIGQNADGSFSSYVLVLVTQILKLLGPLAIAITSMNSGPGQMATRVATAFVTKGTSLAATIGKSNASRIANNLKYERQKLLGSPKEKESKRPDFPVSEIRSPGSFMNENSEWKSQLQRAEERNFSTNSSLNSQKSSQADLNIRNNSISQTIGKSSGYQNNSTQSEVSNSYVSTQNRNFAFQKAPLLTKKETQVSKTFINQKPILNNSIPHKATSSNPKRPTVRDQMNFKELDK